MRDTDYLIVGAGAVGLAFADSLISNSDAKVVIVDKNQHPGGHWNFAYDFVTGCEDIFLITFRT